MSISSPELKPQNTASSVTGSPTLGLSQVARVLRRNFWYVAAGGLIGLLIGASFIKLVQPSYTATSILQIDPRKVRAVQDAYAFASNESSPSDVDLLTQIEVFKSDRLANIVASKLDLHHDSVVLLSPPSPLTDVIASLNSILRLASKDLNEPVPVSKYERDRQRTIDALKHAVSVRRVPRTQVLEISFSTYDAARAADVADAYADAYVEDQLDTERAAAGRASVWLQEQLAQLKDSVQNTEQAVQHFKSRHHMLVANGRSVDDQKLTDVLINLQQLRAETGKAEARHTKLKEIIAKKQTDALLAETFADPQMTQMRGQYLNLAKSETQLAKLLGTQHQAVVRIKSEKDEYSRMMLGELSRIASGYAGELDVARLREKALADEFEQLASKNGLSALAQIELRELERSSDTYKSFYAVILQRNLQALQQQSFSDRGARIISNARIPTLPSGFSPQRILAISLALGAMFGGAMGGFRELSDRTFRTRKQVRDELGVRHAWIVPRIHLSKSELERKSSSESGRPSRSRSEAMLDIARLRPDNTVAAALLDMKSRLDLIETGTTPRVIGITSVVAGAGATTIAANLATVLASTEANTVLVDADSKSATLTKLWTSAVDQKQVGSVSDLRAEDLVRPGTNGAPAFVPAIKTGVLGLSAASSPVMRRLLSELKLQYDYVVVDLPPIAQHAGAINLLNELDALILVVEWARDERPVLAELMRTEIELAGKCLGVALNKTDLARLKKYEPADALTHQ